MTVFSYEDILTKDILTEDILTEGHFVPAPILLINSDLKKDLLDSLLSVDVLVDTIGSIYHNIIIQNIEIEKI